MKSIYSKKNAKPKKAFTLVEILVVILIIGILFILIVPKIDSATTKSKEAGVKTRFNDFRVAAITLLQEHAGFGGIMANDADIEGFVTALNINLDEGIQFETDTISGQYCSSKAKDPWHNNYKLFLNVNSAKNKGTVSFVSYGASETVHAADINYRAEGVKYVQEVSYDNGVVSDRSFTVDTGGAIGDEPTAEPIPTSTPEPTPEPTPAIDGYLYLSKSTRVSGDTGLISPADAGLSTTGNMVIPETITYNGKIYEIRGIHNEVFMGCTNLTSVSIPSTVTSIGSMVFWGCTNLTSVNIPSGVTSIGGYAFRSCSKLTSVSIPSGVTSINQSTFEDCTNLTSITIPNSVTYIEGSAFRRCSKLTSVSIPSGVTSINHSTFAGCTNLTSVNIPSGVTSIGQSAFSACKSLTDINIPSGVTSIGVDAFTVCQNLTSITIPSTVTSIKTRAFDACTRLTDVYFKGTEEQWSAISIESSNTSLTNATIHFNS